MNSIRTFLSIFILLFTVLFTIGCEDKATDVHEEHGVVEHACEHMTDGPDSNVTAVITGSGADISVEHIRYDITLVDTMGGKKGGYVTFKPDQHGEFGVFLNKDVSLTIIGADGTVITKENEEVHLDECSSIAAGGLYHLEDTTNSIYFGPTDSSEVSIVIEEAEHDDHDN